ncbi:hypothetical protein BX666DRAFT_1912940 [Dichotomocladium elegans]|nr:hypothetical protein BX666DRAFT_1912940 [Dichotomocladium elegans]
MHVPQTKGFRQKKQPLGAALLPRQPFVFGSYKGSCIYWLPGPLGCGSACFR